MITSLHILRYFHPELILTDDLLILLNVRFVNLIIEYKRDAGWIKSNYGNLGDFALFSMQYI